jgi:hypothetical protein
MASGRGNGGELVSPAAAVAASSSSSYTAHASAAAAADPPPPSFVMTRNIMKDEALKREKLAAVEDDEDWGKVDKKKKRRLRDRELSAIVEREKAIVELEKVVALGAKERREKEAAKAELAARVAPGTLLSLLLLMSPLGLVTSRLTVETIDGSVCS